MLALALLVVLGPTPAPSPAEWTRPFGTGAGRVASDGARLYATSAVPKSGETPAVEVTTALDPATGKTLWEERTPFAPRPKQEAFGGSPMRPQATPAVGGGLVLTLGFSGVLQARDAATGKLAWGTDLVESHGATPVQYGFAGSPILSGGKLIVPVGGKHAVIAFDPATGEVAWASAPAEPAYATPVPLSVAGRAMIAVLTRDTLLGLDAATGETLWSHKLKDKGLTNVPTPIPLSGGRLLTSGQGVDGTRMLKVSQEGDAFAVSEVWARPKVQFFYTNWLADEQCVYGYPAQGGKRFTALSLADGKTVSQDIGQTDANVVAVGGEFLLCRGDGLLSLGKFTPDGFEARVRGKATSGRVWAAPTVVGGAVIVRSDTELACVRLASLTADFVPPADKGVSALDAAFGGGK